MGDETLPRRDTHPVLPDNFSNPDDSPPPQNLSNVAINRDAVIASVIVGKTIALLGFFAAITLICIEVSSIRESRGSISCKRAKSRAPVWLLAISITGSYILLTCTLMWWVNWSTNVAGCRAIVSPPLPIAYILMKQCLYLFFFDRAKVVHDALKLNSRPMKFLRWTVFLFSTLGIPLVTWWAFFLYWRGRVLPEGVCVEYATTMGGIIGVASIDSVLSLAMLALFIAPMSRHIRRVRDDELSPLFRRLIRRNLIVSCVLLSSTLASLIAMSVELSIAFGEHPNHSVEHLQVWATIFPMMDTILTVVLPHLLSSAWVPTRVLPYLSRLKTPPQVMQEQIRSTDRLSKRPSESEFAEYNHPNPVCTSISPPHSGESGNFSSEIGRV